MDTYIIIFLSYQKDKMFTVNEDKIVRQVSTRRFQKVFLKLLCIWCPNSNIKRNSKVLLCNFEINIAGNITLD